ncbi:MAG TPA: hypothetical protein VJJ26_00310 [Candidatus Babeliales bacterium]|nr:hypothetical protein [Candidatus Babeliales bacterium]
MWIRFTVDGHNTMIECVIKHFINVAARPCNAVISIDFFAEC